MCGNGPTHLLSPVSGEPMQNRLVYGRSAVLDRCKQSSEHLLDSGEGANWNVIANASQTNGNLFDGNKREFG